MLGAVVALGGVGVPMRMMTATRVLRSGRWQQILGTLKAPLPPLKFGKLYAQFYGLGHMLVFHCSRGSRERGGGAAESKSGTAAGGSNIAGRMVGNIRGGGGRNEGGSGDASESEDLSDDLEDSNGSGDGDVSLGSGSGGSEDLIDDDDDDDDGSNLSDDEEDGEGYKFGNDDSDNEF
jgi:hypothetical protein